METTSSISFIMPNLLLGLCKGSRDLRQYSAIFHDQLGYEFFRFELLFPIKTGRNICPDAIVVSNKVRNTLLFEWTEVSNPTLKQDQFTRYSLLQPGDIANTALVPVAATESFDIVLVLRPSAVEKFRQELATRGFQFPILHLDLSDQLISLQKVTNQFQVPNTDDFFSKNILVNRLPRYLRFSLEFFDHKVLVPFVIQELTSLLINRHSSITLIDLCKGIVPVWDLIGEEKQNNIAKVTKEIIRHLIREKLGKQVMKRASDSPPTWTLDHENFNRNPKGFRRMFNDFIREVREESFQLSFDFGIDY